MPVTFTQVNLRRRGRLFPCRGCGKQLVLPKVSIGFAVGGFVTLSLLGKQFGLVSVVVAVIVISLFEWLRAKVALGAGTSN